MNERLVAIPLPTIYPGAAAALGNLFAYTVIPFDGLLVYVEAAPNVDDADVTLDIHDDGTAIVAAMSCADKEIPGTWKSTHVGGAETPVLIAAGSVISFDANSAANATSLYGYMLFLTSDVYA